jgi:DNA-binding transcriptional ArsR family regulator
MKEGPDISIVASLIGDPARANMLTALMAGLALTVTELAQEAGVSLPTASEHLAKLQRAGLVTTERQGRHRYFRLSGPDVVLALEGLMPLAARVGHLRTRTGPSDPALRHARSCYDHLAGHLAVGIFQGLVERGILARTGDAVEVTDKGRRFFAQRAIDIAALEDGRRALCRCCLDWSERKSHLGGALGAALLDRILSERWAVRERGTRAIRFRRDGEQTIQAWLGLRARAAAA